MGTGPLFRTSIVHTRATVLTFGLRLRLGLGLGLVGIVDFWNSGPESNNDVALFLTCSVLCCFMCIL